MKNKEIKYKKHLERVLSEWDYSLHKKCMIVLMKSLENDFTFKDWDNIVFGMEYVMDDWVKRKVSFNCNVTDIVNE